MHRGGVRIGREEIRAAAGIRKGPWQAEEDAALMEYVTKHGPRDWSSIRSKGLLPRTGKSCRLRWVNKLKPGLKTGCKFSAEEERIVIDLQELFGNRWAQIATYLNGRTDNDVKNFWSTRQKRLARLLQSPLPIRNLAGEPVVSTPFSNFEDTNSTDLLYKYSPCLDLIPITEQCSNSQCSSGADAAKMVSVVINPKVVEPAAINEPLPCYCSNSRQTQPPPPPPPLDHHLLNLPPLPEAQDLVLEFDDLPLPDYIACPERLCPAMRLPEVPPAFFELDVADHDNLKIKHPEMPESFFDDFPSDMFDYLEQPVAGHKGS